MILFIRHDINHEIINFLIDHIIVSVVYINEFENVTLKVHIYSYNYI